MNNSPQKPTLYRGVWPQNVSKLAKYAVRFVDGAWGITVLYDIGQGTKYLAVQGAKSDLVNRINDVKAAFNDQPGGAFYVNEYRHIIVPVKGDSASGHNSHYYSAGLLVNDLIFEYQGSPLTTKPIGADGKPLSPGTPWMGPRPGIPYRLAAGGADIYYETPALTDGIPPVVRPRTTRKVQLSNVLGDRNSTRRAAEPVASIRGYQGGRFYVNEHGAIFTPVDAGDGNGLNYIYCGQVDRSYWFPEPQMQG